MKIWSLPKDKNLTIGNKILWKRGEIAPSSFPQYFQCILNFKCPITYTFVKCGCSIYFFLSSAILIFAPSSFPQYFQCILNFKSPITYTFVKCGSSIYFFLSSAILICRGTDILKYFRESLGIRDNERTIYFCLKIILFDLSPSFFIFLVYFSILTTF